MDLILFAVIFVERFLQLVGGQEAVEGRCARGRAEQRLGLLRGCGGGHAGKRQQGGEDGGNGLGHGIRFGS